MVGSGAVTALVVLAGRLPAHAEPGGNVGPADAQADGVLDKHREFRICRLLRGPDAPDPFQHLRGAIRQARCVRPGALRRCRTP